MNDLQFTSNFIYYNFSFYRYNGNHKNRTQRHVIFLIAKTCHNFHFHCHYPVDVSPTLGVPLGFRCYIKGWML